MESGGAMFRRGENLLGTRYVHVGMIKKAETDFRFEDGADGVIDLLAGDIAALNRGGKTLGKGGEPDGHFHVDARAEGVESGLIDVFGKAVFFEAFHGVGIADDKTVEFPLIAKDVLKKPAIAGGGDVVQIEVGAHGGANAGFDGGVKGSEIDVVEESFGKVGFVVVAANNGGAVAREMLHASEDVIRRANEIALKTADLRSGHGGAEIGILAGAFDDAAPARIARDVQHRSKNPVDADGTSFFCGDGLSLCDGSRIPGSSQSDRYREDGAKAVNDIKAKN